MIERLIAGEAALARDELDAAEHLFAQVVDVDPRNAIGVVGLARVADRRGDAAGARRLAEQALSIDPDEAAATRLLAELVFPVEEPSRAQPAEPEHEAVQAPAPETSAPPASARRAAPRRGWRGWLGRLIRRR